MGRCRKTVGSTAKRTGTANNLMKWLRPSCWPGGCSKRTCWGCSIRGHWSRAARYLILHSPVTGQERWEENAGYSAATLASIIAALVCAAEIARRGRDAGNAGRSASEPGAEDAGRDAEIGRASCRER